MMNYSVGLDVRLWQIETLLLPHVLSRTCNFNVQILVTKLFQTVNYIEIFTQTLQVPHRITLFILIFQVKTKHCASDWEAFYMDGNFDHSGKY